MKKWFIACIIMTIVATIMEVVDLKTGFTSFPLGVVVLVASLVLWCAYFRMKYQTFKKWQVILIIIVSIIEALFICLVATKLRAVYPVDRFVAFVLLAYSGVIVLINECVYIVIVIVSKFIQKFGSRSNHPLA